MHEFLEPMGINQYRLARDIGRVTSFARYGTS